MGVLIFLILTAVSCAAETVWSEFPEAERLYAAVTDNRLLPPEETAVVLDGASPRLTWSGREGADAYRIYRAAAGAEAVRLTETKECEFSDTEISVLTHSGIWRYSVAAVNEAGAEGFRSPECAVTVTAPAFEKSARMAEASAGGFENAPEPSVRISFYLPVEAVAFSVLRKEAGKGSVILADAHPAGGFADGGDENGGLSVFYDTTAVPGVFYEYRVIPINALGQYGRESETVEGFVFPPPSLSDWDVTAGKAQTRLMLPSLFRERTVGAAFFFTDPTTGKTETVEVGFPFGFRETVAITESDIRRLLDGCDSRWLTVCAAMVFEDGGGARLRSLHSRLQPILIFSKESASLPVPSSVAVESGRRYADGSGCVPVRLSWIKPSDTRIQGYRIYRSGILDFANGTDSTDWGEPVADVKTAGFGEAVVWEDGDFPRYGAFYYKINPYADENTETQNNRAPDSFAKAAVFPADGQTPEASYREFEDKVRLRWKERDGIVRYNFYALPDQLENVRVFERQSFSVDERGAYFDFPISTVGEVRFRTAPVVVFTASDGTELGEVVGEQSPQAVGAIEINDDEWTRLVMKTVAEAQSRIVPGERGGGKLTKTETVFFYRGVSPHLKWDMYDLYGFNRYTDKNNAVAISGTMAHLYGDGADFSYSIGFSLMSEASVFERIDTTVKAAAPLEVGGVYPGWIYVWARHIGSKEKDAARGLLPVGENQNPQKTIGEFGEKYGFDLTYPSENGFSGGTAYLILRDEADEATGIPYSRIGML